MTSAVRCEHCLTALVTHPNPEIRLEVASDPTTPVSALDALSTDLNNAVAEAAERNLREQADIP